MKKKKKIHSEMSGSAENISIPCHVHGKWLISAIIQKLMWKLGTKYSVWWLFFCKEGLDCGKHFNPIQYVGFNDYCFRTSFKFICLSYFCNYLNDLSSCRSANMTPFNAVIPLWSNSRVPRIVWLLNATLSSLSILFLDNWITCKLLTRG